MTRASGHVLWLPSPERSEDGLYLVLFNAGPDDPGSSEVGKKQMLDTRVLFLIGEGEQMFSGELERSRTGVQLNACVKLQVKNYLSRDSSTLKRNPKIALERSKGSTIK